MRMTFIKVLIVKLLIFHMSQGQREGFLRVYGGSNSRHGRLEIYHSGRWGTICDDHFGTPDAFVACRQLTNRNVMSATFYTAGGGSGTIWMDDLACSGTESKLSSCSHLGWGSHNCGHSEDVGIRCVVANEVHGNWGSWSSWESCSRTCGNGYRKRKRYCNNPSPSSGGVYCSGDSLYIQNCNNRNCPVIGHWGEWSQWGKCNSSCGRGQQQRSRSCCSPAPAFGGSVCSGESVASQTCNSHECPVQGNWGSWTSWQACSRTCGNGYRKRRRYCNNPSPSHGGSYCSGDSLYIQNCNNRNCPVIGHWGEWSQWGKCNSSCGRGQQQRSRSCSSPAPAFGGSVCSGESVASQTCNSHECPVNGGWDEWSEWNDCSVTCGGGIHHRTRHCNNPQPENGGQYCNGTDRASRVCNTTCCPVDGNWGEWSEWGQCNTTCGGGQQQRLRSCTSPHPASGGSNCSGESAEMINCSLNHCPVDGHWAEWSQWGQCNVTCGGGQKRRFRSCTSPVPENGGNNCSGEPLEFQQCSVNDCPVDGGWSAWPGWNDCSVTCGGGIQHRIRYCDNPMTAHGGQYCNGTDMDSQSCKTDCCPVDGNWSDWSEWEQCDASCGGGQKQRMRSCTLQAPAFGGLECSGKSMEHEKCSLNDCPFDGHWTVWSKWEQCTVTCGGGQKRRSRSCTSPMPANGGQNCSGEPVELQQCSPNYCPVDGNWRGWSAWGQCDASCGGGQQQRSRSCTLPAPAFGGLDCNGESMEKQICSSFDCPVDGGWTTWLEWNDCSVTCGGGIQHRSRYCNNPMTEYGGQYCNGTDTDSRSCKTDCCPVDGKWTEWSEWGQCNASCGGGQQQRSRSCTFPSPAFGGSICTGVSMETQICSSNDCPVNGHWAEWSKWGQCNVTCGGGQQRRSRSCTFPVPAYGGDNCRGEQIEFQQCSSNDCPVDGGWSAWLGWNECSVTCGGGIHIRNRFCDNPVTVRGGQYCNGTDTDSRSCKPDCCPVNGNWSEWSKWGQCDTTCGGGQEQRRRSCTFPAPSFGGLDCSGVSMEQQLCSSNDCPVNGEWGNWLEWTDCSSTCGGGMQRKTRYCDNPMPVHGGQYCNGTDTDSRSCNTGCCPVDGNWTEWSEWGQCNITCGGGQQQRMRSCSLPMPAFGGADCNGEFREIKKCSAHACPVDGKWSAWSGWIDCSVTCGGGIHHRVRHCNNPITQHGGHYCNGTDTESRSCNNGCCPVGGEWGEWTDWERCNVTCGGGYQQRSRSCSNPAPIFGGTNCHGDKIELLTCALNDCPVNGEWSAWSEWKDCSASCGGGVQQKIRNCDNPTPLNGGFHCNGTDTVIRSCNNGCCLVDVNWGPWSEWGLCNDTRCGGTQNRSRRCDSPFPSFGGIQCSGLDYDSRSCNDSICLGQESIKEMLISIGIIGGSTVGCILIIVVVAVLLRIGHLSCQKIKQRKDGTSEDNKCNIYSRGVLEELKESRIRQKNYSIEDITSESRGKIWFETDLSDDAALVEN